MEQNFFDFVGCFKPKMVGIVCLGKYTPLKLDGKEKYTTSNCTYKVKTVEKCLMFLNQLFAHCILEKLIFLNRKMIQFLISYIKELVKNALKF